MNIDNAIFFSCDFNPGKMKLPSCQMRIGEDKIRPTYNDIFKQLKKNSPGLICIKIVSGGAIFVSSLIASLLVENPTKAAIEKAIKEINILFLNS